MLKKLRVRNFLSLRDAELHFGPRTLLVGPNMSGKSNLIACLKFLALALCSGPDSSGRSGLERTVFQAGGMRELAWKGADDPSITVEMAFSVPGANNQPDKIYQYEIVLIGNLSSDDISVRHESLVLKTSDSTKRLFEVDNGRGVWLWQGKLTDLNLGEPRRSVLEAVNLPDFEGSEFRNLISRWRYYHLVPLLMREENRPTPANFLGELGENFSTWIFTLQTHPVEFGRLKQAACDVLPSLADILLEPTQAANVFVSSREKGLKRPVSIKRMSDGELAFLALLSLIFAPEELGAPLYCIEEPESHLHPLMLESLVEFLDQRQQELGPRAAQVIATTHSPHLVDKVNIEELVVVEKIDGETRFVCPGSDEDLRKLVSSKESGLGDLWYSGALGGI